MNFPIFAHFLLAIAPTSTGIISGWIGPYKPMLIEQNSDEFSQEDHPKFELIETGRPDRPDSFFLLDTVVESTGGKGKKVDKNALIEAEVGQAEQIAKELVAIDKIESKNSPIAFHDWVASTNGLLLVGTMFSFFGMLMGTILMGHRTKIVPKVYELKEFTHVPLAEEAFPFEEDENIVCKPTVEEA